MSCSAKLPIYAFFVSAFFPGKGEESETAGKSAKRRNPEHEEPASLEPSALMWGPLIALSVCALLVGIFGRGIADGLAANLAQLF